MESLKAKRGTNGMTNQARDALNRVRRLLRNDKISAYWISKHSGVSTSQITRMRRADDLRNIRIETLIKLIDYMETVQNDKFRTK